ncbi:MAG TPA: TlpA disulfide reductase family protein, partial [Ignavibacteriaceae bacterium]
MIRCCKFHFFILGLILFIGLKYEVYSQSNSIYKVNTISVSDLTLILEEEKGLATLINVWATWCEPCREEFPDLVELSNTYRKEIRFIGISADDVDELDSKVIPFLKNQN